MMVRKPKTVIACLFSPLVWTVVAALPAFAYASSGLNSKSLAELDAMAKRGNAQAQYEMATRYARGQGVAMNKPLALEYFNAAAERGFAQAEYELAKHYSGLSGEKYDPEQALAYTTRAAEHGHVQAQVDLGFVYYNGNAKVPKNLPLSFQWYATAAGKGSVTAQCMLGDFYKTGVGGVKQNYAEAVKWYKLTAVKEDKCAPKSQFELYVSYEAGHGVKKDLKTAVDWLRKAADAGNPEAQSTLGRLFQKGYGVPQDSDMAKFWLRKSREGVAPHDDHEHEVHAIFKCPSDGQGQMSRSCMLKSMFTQINHGPVPKSGESSVRH